MASSSTAAIALQLCPFSAYLEAGLAQRFRVVRWFELDAAQRTHWLAQHAAAVHAVVTGGHIGCPGELMQALPALGIIAVNGVGVDKIDSSRAHARGIRISTTPGLLADDVADLAVGLVIALLRGIPAADAFVRSGAWVHGERALAHKVSGRRFGIVGLGQIGRAIAARLSAFGPVAYTGPHRKDVPYEFHAEPRALAQRCDVLLLSCPATPATHHLIDGAVLEALGPNGYLVNVARGAIVDEPALIAALQSGRIAGAALDVYANEPHVPESLRACANVVLTPHMASATLETRTAMADRILADLDEFARSRAAGAA